MAAPPQPFDPNTAGNMPEIEMQFAVKCIEHAENYWNLIHKLKPSNLKLSRWDDDIYAAFQEKFPDMASDKDGQLSNVSEDWMKSKEGKEAWRDFFNQFEKVVDDYNYGTLLRRNVKEDYTEANSIFVLRIQFLAVEITRNRLGLNDPLWEAGKTKSTG